MLTKPRKRHLSSDSKSDEQLQGRENVLAFQTSTSEPTAAATQGDGDHPQRARSASGGQSQFSEPSFAGHGFSIDLLEAINAVSHENPSNPYPLLSPQDQLSFQIPLAKLDRSVKEQLLRHFVENLGSAFSLCDPNRRVAMDLPEHATSNGSLVDLILSVSAKHLYQITGSAQFSEARFSDCPTDLIRNLCDPGAMNMDDTSLAIATLLLRLGQNMEGEQQRSKPFGVFLASNTDMTIQVPVISQRRFPSVLGQSQKYPLLQQKHLRRHSFGQVSSRNYTWQLCTRLRSIWIWIVLTWTSICNRPTMNHGQR